MTSSRLRSFTTSLLFAFAAFTALPVFAQAPAPAAPANDGAPYQVGRDYFPIEPAQSTNTGDKIEVIEIFGYSCPHCAHLAPLLEEWKAKLPNDVELHYMPAVFGGIWEVYGRAYYAAETMGVLAPTHEALFTALHTEKRKIASLEDLAAWYAEHGVDKAQFLATMESFTVNAKIAQAQQQVPRYGVDGTPSLIVNGKYRVVAPHEGGFAKMLQITDWLIERERAAKKAG